MSAKEVLEHMEHAGHAGHGGHQSHGRQSGKPIGITMALLGVLLAFCAAMVGSARTELIRTTVEQSNKWGIYQSEAVKFRLMEASHELLRALTPKADEVAKIDATLRAKRAPSGRNDDEDTAELKDLIASAVDDLADLVTPDADEKARFAGLARRYEHDMREAKEDAEAYDLAIEAHHQASEWYERAQLMAEIGIVVASVALLLSSRFVWVISILLGLASLGTVGYTFAHTRGALRAAEQKIEEAVKRTEVIEAHDAEESDGPAHDGTKPAPPKPEGGHEEGKPAGHK